MVMIDKYLFKKKWRKYNKHNFTNAEDIFDMSVVSVGKCTYGGIKVLTYNKTNKLTIGNYCSIGPEVLFVLSADHYLNHISTYPFKTKLLNGELEGVSKGDIVIGDDVWIGARSIILSGIKIGQGAVIAAGSVVTKEVPPYAIVAGVPARTIKYRFNDEIVNELLKLNYEKLTTEKIELLENELYTELNNKEQCLQILNKINNNVLS